MLANLCNNWSQSYQTLISLFFRFLLLSLAFSKYRQYLLMLQTLKLNNKKQKKSSFCEEKSLVGLTPDLYFLCKEGKPSLNLALLQQFMLV
jgi:hypothetical protein